MYLDKTRKFRAHGMTLLEVTVTSAVFALLSLVAFAALQSTRAVTSTDSTQVDLQESARLAIMRIADTLRNAGRYTDANGHQYPVIFKSQSGIPTGYNVSNAHAPKFSPVATPGTLVNGGDPSLDSDEIIFKMPLLDYKGVPVISNGAMTWSTSETGIFIVPGNDNINQIELRDSAASAAQAAAGLPVQGDVLARYVDRIQISDSSTDPLLTSRQLRVTVYLTRHLPQTGGLSGSSSATLMVSLSAVVDMRNTSLMQ